MRKSYRYVLFTTFGIIAFTILVLFVEGFSGDQMPTTCFISIYALFNIYMYIMAYLYSPVVDDGMDYSEQSNKSRDHDQIMS